jgi:DNA-binding HxlR family transcriptional regulator
MRWDELGEERCSIARTVSVIGDRWTLLILRDCFLRVRRFEEFEAPRHYASHIG